MKCSDCGRIFNVEEAREEFDKNGFSNHQYNDFLKNYGLCDWCAINYLNQLKTGRRVSYDKIPVACRACRDNLNYPECKDDCLFY